MDETLASLQVRISASSEDAAGKIDNLANALKRLKSAVEGGVGDLGAIAQQLEQLSKAASEAANSASAVDRLATALQKLSGLNISPNLGANIGATVDALSRINIGNIVALSAFAAALRGLGRIDLSGLAALNGLSFPNIPNDLGDRLARIGEALGRIPADAARRLSDIATSLRGLAGIDLTQVARGLKDFNVRGIKIRINTSDVVRATGRIQFLGGLLESFGRIAFYRIVRNAIKAIGEAFRTGSENAYWYSKTIGDGTKYIAEAYDQVATKSFTMTNQLGAALATLKAAVTPVLLEIIQLATMAANALTQLFAALGGQGQYLRAKDTIKEAYENTAKGAAAAKEWRNQLMGFDEINRLEEPSSGGRGGGAAAADYGSMFDEAEVEGWAKIVADNFEWIASLAGLVGIGLMSWAKSAGVISPKFAALVGLITTIAGTIALINNGIDAWKNGIDSSNLLGMLEGAVFLAGGLFLLFGKVAGAIGLIISGVELLVIGFHEWIETGQLANEVFLSIEAGFLLVGAGFALITGSWIPALIAGVAAAVVAVIKYWDDIEAFFANLWASIKAGALKFWSSVVSFYTEQIPNAIRNIIAWFGELPEKVGYAVGVMVGTIITWFMELGAQVAIAIPNIIASIVKFFQELPDKIHTAIRRFVTETLPKWGESITSWATTTLPRLIESIGKWFENLPAMLVNVGQEMVIGLWNGIVSLIDWLGGNISAFFNNLFGGFGVGFVKGMTHVFGGRYASGGFPSTGELFLAREAGPELVGTMNGQNAVANNQEITEGIYRAAYQAFTDAMSGGGSDRDVHIYLDGREIANTTTRYQRQFARANG